MEKPSKKVFCPKLKEIILSYAAKKGLTVKAIEIDSANKVTAKAAMEPSLGGDKVLIEALDMGRRPGKRQVSSLKKAVDAGGFGQGVLISTIGFSQSAVKQSEKEGLELFDCAAVFDSSRPNHLENPEHNILERVFKKRWNPDEARQIMESKKRKIAFGLLGYSERLDSISHIYSPIARFDLDGGKKVFESLREQRQLNSKNTFWVNLENCRLYYMSFGFFGAGMGIKSTNILRRMMDLEEGAVRTLSHIFEAGQVGVKELNAQKDPLFNPIIGEIMRLERMGLICPDQSGSRYMSNIPLPPFDDARYDIGGYTTELMGHETTDNIDPVKYPINGILMLLCDFFNCTGSFCGVKYLASVRARFVSNDGLVRYEQIPNLEVKDAP